MLKQLLFHIMLFYPLSNHGYQPGVILTTCSKQHSVVYKMSHFSVLVAAFLFDKTDQTISLASVFEMFANNGMCNAGPGTEGSHDVGGSQASETSTPTKRRLGILDRAVREFRNSFLVSIYCMYLITKSVS